MMVKKLSSTIFGIALICFFLPWVNVSCQNQKVASFTGIQLVTGTTVEEPQMFGPKKERKINGEPLAILSFLSVIAGFALGFLKDKKGTTGPAIAGGIGIILLLLLKSKLDNDILRETGGMLQVDYEVGFYLTLISFLSAIGINIYSIMQEKGLSLPHIKSQSADHKFCSQCGTMVAHDSAFCSECGHSLK